MKVLHVLDHSLPRISGYSLRSEYIIRWQKRLGLHPVVVTSPEHQDFTDECERIDGIEFYRLHRPSFSSSSKIQTLPLVRQLASEAAFSREIRRLIEDQQIDLVHAHSPSLNGLAVARAAAEAGRPWIYELRYCEEDAAVSRGEIRHNSLRYRVIQKLEQSCLDQAPCVVAISTALRDELLRRGMAESRIFEVPQGVDPTLFQPRQPDPELVGKYNLKGKTVIGFIGSTGPDDGLITLIDAILLMLKEGREVRALLVGGGQAELWWEQIPRDWRDHFIYAGRVPHQEIDRYYSLMDVVVYSRLRSRETELTPPLNLLEAMAMERPVVSAGLDVIREWIRDGETGYLIEEADGGALAADLSRVIDDPARRTIGEQARAFALGQEWGPIVQRYLTVYERALK
ncbi:MAG TPA: glycosyltransferase [Blastocatellia bacterium]|nr:glycosyltransferase [Blastocatellia bacterium]